MARQDFPRLPPRPARAGALEEMPSPSTPRQRRIALVSSLAVLGATFLAVTLLLRSAVPHPKATVGEAQRVVEDFLKAASLGDLDSMRTHLSYRAESLMDGSVLLAISDFMKTRVGEPQGFQRLELEVLESGENARLYLVLDAAGLYGKARSEATLRFEGAYWRIEAIDLRQG